MKNIIFRSIALTLSTSLLLGSVQGLSEADFAEPSFYQAQKPLRYFRINQEKMRVEVEALIEQSTSSHVFMLENKHTHPFYSSLLRLLIRFKNSGDFLPQISLKDRVVSAYEALKAWSDKPVMNSYPWLKKGNVAGVVLLIGTLKIQSAFALATGTVGVMTACGNVWIVLLRNYKTLSGSLDKVVKLQVPVTVGEDVLKPGFEPTAPNEVEMTVEELLQEIYDLLDVRGRLQAGMAEYSSEGVLTVKINAPRRGKLSHSLLTAFKLAKKGVQLSAEEGVWRISGHVRAPTRLSASGRLEQIAAHPHQYLASRDEQVGGFGSASYIENPLDGDRASDENVAHLGVNVDGDITLFLEKKHLSIKIGHNGNNNKLHMHGREITNSFEMYDLLDPILGTHGTIKTGDSRVLAGLMDLFFVLGRMNDAARLAYHTAVVKSSDEDPAVRFPPQSAFQRYGDFLNVIIQDQALRGRLGRRGQLLTVVPQAQIDEAKLRALQAITTSSSASPTLHFSKDQEATIDELKEWPLQNRVAFVNTAIDAYFHNDLFTATTQMMKRVEGTFGLVIETTEDSPENQELITVSRSQRMSIGFDLVGHVALGSSSRHALAKFRHRLDLDSQGEIVGVSWRTMGHTGRREFSLRSRLENGDRDISEAELRGRLIDRHLNRWMETPPPVTDEDRVLSETERIPAILHKSEVSYHDPESSNSQTVKAITGVLEEVVAKKRRGDFMLMGSEKSLQSAKNWVRAWRQIIPVQEFTSRVQDPNPILKEKRWPRNLKKVLGITEDTVVIPVTASGGDTFDTSRATELLTGFVKDMFVFSGLWDIDLAGTVGQGLHKDSPPSKRLINTYGGWSLAEPATLSDAATEFSLTQVMLRSLHQLKANHPEENPLGMKLELEDFEALEGPITQEFLRHASTIIGVKATLGADGRPERIPSEKHDEILANAKGLTQRSLENIIINFIAAPIIYGVAVKFSLPLFPSSVWAAVQPFLAKLANGAVSLASSLSAATLDPAMHKTFAMGFNGLLSLGATPVSWVWHGVLLLSNIAFVILFPWVVMYGYRWLQGREPMERRGPVTTVIGDPSYPKGESLYSKLHSGVFNENEPVILGGDQSRNFLHKFAHRVRRGTRILLTMASEAGIDSADRAASNEVKGQALLIQHIGVGPQLILFEHLPYKTPIRAPYIKFETHTANELHLDPQQILGLHHFLENLREEAKATPMRHLSDELGKRLGLESDRLAIFKDRFDNYIERQLAFEEFFKIRFGEQEVWMQHYVMAHAWAQQNAHPWFLKIAVVLLDHMPFRDRLLQRYPHLAIYIDVARTFVGTGRITTASPADGDDISELRNEYPSKLRDLRDPTPAPPVVTPEVTRSDEVLPLPRRRAVNEAPEVPRAPRRTPLQIVDPAVSPADVSEGDKLRDRIEAVTGKSKNLPSTQILEAIKKQGRNAKRGRRKESSLLPKSPMHRPIVEQRTVQLNKDGTLGSAIGVSLSDAEYAMLQDIVNNFHNQDMKLKRSYHIAIADLKNRASFVTKGTYELNPETQKKILVPQTIWLDRVMLEEAVEGKPGAKAALSLEYFEGLQALPDVSGVKQDSENRVTRERRLLLKKIDAFLALPDDVRKDVIQYLGDHEIYDSHPDVSFTQSVYVRANTEYLKLREQGVKDYIAILDVKKKIRPAIYRYVDKALNNTEDPEVAEVEEAQPEPVVAPVIVEPVKVAPPQISQAVEANPMVVPVAASVLLAEPRATARILNWNKVMSVLLLALSLPTSVNLPRVPQNRATLSSMTPLPTPPAVTAPAARAAKPYIVSPSKEENLFEFMEELRDMNPTLKDVLGGELKQDKATRERLKASRDLLWKVIDPQIKSQIVGKPDSGKLSPNLKLDISGLLKSPPAVPSALDKTSSASKEIQTVAGIIAAVVAMLGAASTLWATPLSAAASAGSSMRDVALQAVQSGAQITVPFTHRVTEGQWLEKIARLQHTTVSKLIDPSLNPGLAAHKNMIQVGDLIYLPGSETVTLPSIPTYTPSVLPLHVDVTPFMHSTSHLASYALEGVLIAAALGFMGWLLYKYRPRQLSWGFSLKTAVAGVLAAVQLATPATALMSRPADYVLPSDVSRIPNLVRPADIIRPRVIYRAEMTSAQAVREEQQQAPSADAKVSVPVEQQPDVTDETLAKPAVEETAQAPAEAPIKWMIKVDPAQNPLKAVQMIVGEIEKTPYPVLKAIYRYQLSIRMERLSPGDYRKFMGMSKLSKLRVFNVPGLLFRGLQYTPSHKDAVAFQEYAMFLVKQAFLDAQNDATSRHALYQSALALEKAQQALQDETKIPEAAEVVSQTKQAWEVAQKNVDLTPQFLKATFALYTDIEPLQKEMKKGWFSKDYLEKHLVPKHAELLAQTQGKIPDVFAAPMTVTGAQQASAHPWIAARMGQRNQLNAYAQALESLLEKSPETTTEDASVGAQLALQMKAAAAEANYKAAELATATQLDLNKVIATNLLSPAPVAQLTGPAEQVLRSPVQREPKWFENLNDLSAKVGDKVSAQQATAKAYGQAHTAWSHAQDKVRQDVEKRTTLAAAAETIIQSLDALTVAEAEAGVASVELGLGLGQAPERLLTAYIDKNVIQSGLKSVALTLPPVMPLPSLDAAETQKAQFNGLSRRITGTTDSAELFQAFFEANHLNPIDPKIPELAKVTRLDTHSSGDAFVTNLKLAALIIQADAHLRGQAVPSVENALTQAIQTYTTKGALIPQTLSRISILKIPAGVAPLEFIAKRLSDALAFPIKSVRSRTTLTKFLEQDVKLSKKALVAAPQKPTLAPKKLTPSDFNLTLPGHKAAPKNPEGSPVKKLKVSDFNLKLPGHHVFVIFASGFLGKSVDPTGLFHWAAIGLMAVSVIQIGHSLWVLMGLPRLRAGRHYQAMLRAA